MGAFAERPGDGTDSKSELAAFDSLAPRRFKQGDSNMGGSIYSDNETTEATAPESAKEPEAKDEEPAVTATDTEPAPAPGA